MLLARFASVHFRITVTMQLSLKIQPEEGGDSAQYLNSFFSCLAAELHEPIKARLENALNRIEEETQEAEV